MPRPIYGTGTRRTGADNFLARVSIGIDRELKDLLDEEYKDPQTGKPTYGYLSQLISDLLREHCKKLKLLPSRRAS